MEKFIVGLGNPGKKYENTRHNVGFQAVNFLAQESDADHFLGSSHANAVTAEVMLAGKKVLLAKPQTFMNKSGQAVAALASYFDTDSENILIIHDDVDLPFGEVRVSSHSSAGGHNGVQSVIDQLGAQGFVRVRIGIAPGVGKTPAQKPKQMSARDFVLQQFSRKEQEVVAEDILPRAAVAVSTWVKKGKEAAMNEVNG